MKICFVRRGYSPTGGAEAYLQRLAQKVAADGHHPMLVTSPEWPESAWPNECVVRLNGDAPLRFAEEVARTSEECEVVFSLERILSCDVYRAGDGVHRAWLDRRAAFEPGWRSWTRWANRKHRELLKLEKCMFSPDRTRYVIANSNMVRDEIVALYGYPAEKIEVIANGYDAPPLVPGLREKRRAELGIETAAFVALFAGSGWARKGLATAVKAMQSIPAARLLVAGKGNPAPFQNACGVTFLGPRNDLQADFAAADVFVLPTIYDPFSNACLEALAAGLPVLTTTANGFSEIITDGVHGSVVTPGDTPALAAALVFWSQMDRALLAQAKCRELAARYSVSENSRRTLDLLMRAMPK